MCTLSHTPCFANEHSRKDLIFQDSVCSESTSYIRQTGMMQRKNGMFIADI